MPPRPIGTFKLIRNAKTVAKPPHLPQAGERPTHLEKSNTGCQVGVGVADRVGVGVGVGAEIGVGVGC